ncbi:hypothetical protein Q1695_016344 [Nippostrongylus brasiliensis]|nr:hypothetical protein Q1695_016344 [Nippostrongylus brasiliensis]
MEEALRIIKMLIWIGHPEENLGETWATMSLPVWLEIDPMVAKMKKIVEVSERNRTRSTLKNRPDNASECLPHVTSYDVEASQGAAASECA